MPRKGLASIQWEAMLVLDVLSIPLQDRLEDKDVVETKKRKESPDGPKEAESKVLSLQVSVGVVSVSVGLATVMD